MFKGSIPALITPMTEDGSVDYDAFEKFVDWQISQGSHGLVPVGTTGESPTLNHAEHKQVVERTIRVADGRVPVIAGTGSNSTREAIDLTQEAERQGASGALVVTPYYNKPNQDGLYVHFKAIHDETNLPIVIYNIPGRSVIDMSVGTMARLFELPRIVGVKDATADLTRVALQRSQVGADFIQLSGEDPTAVGFNAMGGHGCISVTANVAPHLCAGLQQACIDGEYALAVEYQDRLTSLHSAMFCDSSPAPAKYAASTLGLCSPRCRLPIVPLSDEKKAIIDQAMITAGLVEG